MEKGKAGTWVKFEREPWVSFGLDLTCASCCSLRSVGTCRRVFAVFAFRRLIRPLSLAKQFLAGRPASTRCLGRLRRSARSCHNMSARASIIQIPTQASFIRGRRFPEGTLISFSQRIAEQRFASRDNDAHNILCPIAAKEEIQAPGFSIFFRSGNSELHSRQ